MLTILIKIPRNTFSFARTFSFIKRYTFSNTFDRNILTYVWIKFFHRLLKSHRNRCRLLTGYIIEESLLKDVNLLSRATSSERCLENVRITDTLRRDDSSKFSRALSLIEHPVMESVFSASCNARESIKRERGRSLILVKQ